MRRSATTRGRFPEPGRAEEQHAALLGDEDPPVGRERDRRRLLEPAKTRGPRSRPAARRSLRAPASIQRTWPRRIRWPRDPASRGSFQTASAPPRDARSARSATISPPRALPPAKRARRGRDAGADAAEEVARDPHPPRRSSAGRGRSAPASIPSRPGPLPEVRIVDPPAVGEQRVPELPERVLRMERGGLRGRVQGRRARPLRGEREVADADSQLAARRIRAQAPAQRGQARSR